MLMWLKRKVQRLAQVAEWVYRRLANKPIFDFEWIGPDAQVRGEAVGDPIKVPHPMLHDMQSWLVCGTLTTLVLLFGKKVNAVQILGCKETQGIFGVTTIQPRYIRPV